MRSKISVILVFVILTPLLYAQGDIKIVSSDRNSIVIEFTPEYLNSDSIKINGEDFLKINFSGGFYPDDQTPGIPARPHRSLEIGVPSETGNTIQVIKADYKTIDGKILPIPEQQRVNNIDEAIYKTGSDYFSFSDETELVHFGNFGLLRGLPVQSIRIAPVKFSPADGKITLYTRILFRIDFSSNQAYSQVPAENFIADAVLNFNEAKHWVKKTPGLNKITANSVLSDGKWVRITTPEEGIYKISRADFITWGFDGGVDPRTIKIFNNGGKMLPERVTQVSSTDLIENAITITGEEDGVFNETDYILFYGRGINFWDYDSTSGKIVRYFHPYSTENYYFITAGGAPGKRIQNKSNPPDPAELIVSTSPAFVHHEEDKINIVQSGRIYLGDEFTESAKSKTYMNNLEGRVDGSELEYKFNFVNSDNLNRQLSIEENGASIYSSLIPGTISYGFYSSYQTGMATIASVKNNITTPENRSLLKFTFNASGLLSKGYLDYFEIQYQRYLTAYGDKILFFSPDTTGLTEYRLGNFSTSNIRVFDISDFANVKLISDAAISGGNYFFKSFETTGKISKYLAIGNDNFLTAINPVEVPNSDIHGITTGAKFIIISHSNFRQQADILKQHRETHPVLPLSTLVVDIDHLYNEFSGGLKDVTAIRNFIKYAYDNWEIEPEYVLLFGDGDYDFKNVEGYGRNFIPPYQFLYTDRYDNNFSHVHSYNTDDYFVRVSGDDNVVDLAIGRIAVLNASEAQSVIDKIIYYELQSEKGIWRNSISLVADDGYTSSGWEGETHTRASETLDSIYIPKSFDINKIYLAAYPAVLTSAGKRKPTVTQAIVKAINDGTLILNYTGHGSPEVWAHEVVFEKSQTIPRLNNDKYFFLTAATCDFSFFDNPATQSGGEELLNKPSSGAIAVFSATRAVFGQLNNNLMYGLYSKLLSTPRDTLNLPITIGRASLLTKISFNSVNDQKFHLLGDPTLRLNIPRYNAAIDSINGNPSSVITQVKALGKTHIKGQIRREDGTLWENYNGEGLLTMFDSKRRVQLPELNNFGVTYPGGVIFKGRVSVTNGKFEADFIVPKDISYENKNGKILFYFHDAEIDGLGFTGNILVGGTDTTAVNDGKGPEIEIHFNSTTSGTYLVTPDALLIVQLEDETGLNTTGSGIGHMLEGVLNDNENDPIDFSNYFTGDLDAGGRSGQIQYKFDELAEGEYKILVKAWDVFNNFSTETSYFTVTAGNDLVVRDVYNYPNPFSGSTTFTFQQNLTTPVDLKIKVYTVAGRLIKEIERFSYTGGFVTVDWDGRDNDGSPVANGTYLYKVIVSSIDGQFNKSVLGKLAIIR